MASPSDTRNPTSDDTEVTSQHRAPNMHGLDQGPYSDKEFSVGYPLTRQNTIYSLTLDEIQNTVCEPGRNFGSMNMDEFLTNIWNAEEGQALGQATSGTASSAGADTTSNGGVGLPLQRQGSLMVPPPLSRKTVEEVWTEIHRSHGGPVSPPGTHQAVNGGAAASGRQPTFGEMTLEDFLIKAGVVREPTISVRVAPPQFGQMPVYPMGPEMGGGMFGAPIMGGVNMNMNMNMNMNGSMMHGMMVGPVGSPRTPDGVGDDMVGYERVNGRKRSAGVAGRSGDGLVVEKGVERRQRRMIKNRESAARSRARKQAYTVELEAELTELKEENARLKAEEKKVLELKRKMLLETITEQAHVHAQQAKGSLRRSFTCRW